MSFTFLVCKMCISSRIKHFGTVLSIVQQQLFSTLKKVLLNRSFSCILHFMQIISALENATWFYTSRVALIVFFRHLQHLVHFKPSLSRDDVEPVVFRMKPLAQQLTQQNKQEPNGLLPLCSACQAQGGGRPRSSLEQPVP